MLTKLKSGLIGAAVLALGLVTAAATVQTAEARTVDEAKASGVLRVGIQGDNCPWGCINSSGEADGFDAAMGHAFAAYLGVKVEFMPLAVANRIPALLTDKVDVLFATMAMLPDRAKSIQFSRPYNANQMAVIGPVDMDLSTPESLGGHSFGVPRSAAQDTALTALAPEGTQILRFDDDAATIQALLSGQVEAVGGNQFYMTRIEQAAPGKYKAQLPLTQLYNGAGTRLGELDWSKTVNEFLDAFMQAPDYIAVYQKWMDMDPPAFPDHMDGITYQAE